MKINIDMEAERKSQEASDQGFRTWKNKAKDVAEECIIGKGIGAPSECEVLAESETEATVRVVTKKDGVFKVKLKKLVRPDGIWTATEVEKEEE